MSYGRGGHLALLALLVIYSLSLGAQEGPQSNQAKPNRTVKSNVLVNVTGCLKKNAASGGYYITGQQGQTWELSSNKVDLATQVFHTVRVSGHPSSAPRPQDGKSGQEQKQEGESPVLVLDVTELEMVSPSCTR